jgi:hypothetical protein
LLQNLHALALVAGVGLHVNSTSAVQLQNGFSRDLNASLSSFISAEYSRT